MNTHYTSLIRVLGEHRVRLDVPLAPFTTFKIGGPADLLYRAQTAQELVGAISEAGKLNIPVFVLGGGSNILFGDKGYRGLVVKNETKKILIRAAKGSLIKGKREGGQIFVEADSGVMFNALVRFTLEEGLSGLEMHLGLPGTVGGALYMNSKWTHPPAYVGEAVYQATILTPQGKLTTVPQSYFQFGYDTSVLQKNNSVVITVVFMLTAGSKEKLWKIADESIAYRRQSQPAGVFSPGCTFRNLSESEAITAPTPNRTLSAGFLIDHAGLKGVSEGGAYFSDVHANFIINKGSARASDVVKLIERAKEQVKHKFGVTLEEEIVRIGEF